jgi:hypothetical protein
MVAIGNLTLGFLGSDSNFASIASLRSCNSLQISVQAVPGMKSKATYYLKLDQAFEIPQIYLAASQGQIERIEE